MFEFDRNYKNLLDISSKEMERLDKKIQEKDKEIERLNKEIERLNIALNGSNNIITELEKWLNNQDYVFTPNNTYMKVYFKLKELKGSDKE